ncbi:glycosyltransferase family 1 protein [Polaribacter sp. ALD11]|uniref:glycosyltransferase family 4 protein n=1 Tax=Polaribacter sp. ALD11 TaxID=2058137 RepID=UPI0018E1E855|nr:glycosyltransferase family 1 protein [Polaribacter sp. ALD11]
MKEKIVIDARMINNSGIGTYLKNIIPFFIDKFNVVLLGDKKQLVVFENKEKNNIISFSAKIYSIEEQLAFPFVIPSCNIFWSPHFNTPIFPTKAGKYITTIHDVNHLAFDGKINYLKKKYAKFLYLNALNKSDKIITVSNFSKNEIIRFLKPKNNCLNVIYGGVNASFFNTNNKDINFKLPEKYILFVGNVKPHKNLITLFEAYVKLPKNIKEKYQLLILGKKNGFITPDKKVFKFIEDNDLSKNIVFTGFVEDKFLPLIYKKAALFVFPSLYEGFGLPILESMASKTVVLSSSYASLPEVGQDCAIYFDPKNSVDLKEKIVEVLSNDTLRELYIGKGYIHSKKFSWKISAEKHINLFKTS